LFADLARGGVLAIDEPAAKHLPADFILPERDGRAITLADLATHTAGLPRFPSMNGPDAMRSYSVADLKAWLAAFKLPRAPGSGWEYSNMGYALRRLFSIVAVSFIAWAAEEAVVTASSIDLKTTPAPTETTPNANAAKSEAGEDDPCGNPLLYPSPAYPLPVYSAQQMAAMVKRPVTVPELLWNLKLVFDRNLLAQPSFFEDQPHTYDSGYVRLRFDPIEGFTLGTVRKVFGPNPGHFDAFCKEPPPLSYPTGVDIASDTFLLNVAEFGADRSGYVSVCQSKSRQELPDEDLVRTVSIRLMEQDYTVPGVNTP
jgi:hypothetical protein